MKCMHYIAAHDLGEFGDTMNPANTNIIASTSAHALGCSLVCARPHAYGRRRLISHPRITASQQHTHRAPVPPPHLLSPVAEAPPHRGWCFTYSLAATVHTRVPSMHPSPRAHRACAWHGCCPPGPAAQAPWDDAPTGHTAPSLAPPSPPWCP